MGIFLLAAIVFILFIIFIADLIRDSREHRHTFNHRLYNRYGQEIGEEEDFELDLDDQEDLEVPSTDPIYPFNDGLEDYDVEIGDMDFYSQRYRDIERTDEDQ
jgi:hypothetical protein